MLKKLLLLFTFGATSAFSMDYVDLRPWVKQAAFVKVRSLTEVSSISINDCTTIQHVKTSLNEEVGLPVAQIDLTAKWRNAWNLWLVEYNSNPLNDAVLVKQVMSDFNTDILGIYLKSRNG